MDNPQKYAIVFVDKATKRKMVADMTLPNRNDKNAMKWAKLKFASFDLEAVKPYSTPEQYKAIEDEVNKKQPDLVPLDELTDGMPNLVLSKPELLQPEAPHA